MTVHSSYADIRPERPVPAGVRIGHVHLKVADLQRALGFYVGVLGFELVTMYGDQAAFISAGGYHHHLGLNTWAGEAPPAGDDDAKLLRWTLEVPRPDETIAHLERAGVDVARDDKGGAIVADPWGTQLRIVAAG